MFHKFVLVPICCGPLSLGCGATSVDATVTRAPAVPVYREPSVALAPLEVTGTTRYRTEFACGGEAAGVLGPVPGPRLNQYREGLDALVRGVLAENQVTVVPSGEAEQTLRLTARVVETQSVSYQRCDDSEDAEAGVSCLPDPVIDGKHCGCVHVKEGKVNPDEYHFTVHASGPVRIELVARLEAADGTSIGEQVLHLAPPPLFNGGVLPCRLVMGQPEKLERCQGVKLHVLSDDHAPGEKTLEETAANFEEGFRASFAAAVERENGGRRLREAMFPFEAAVRYTVFRLGEPKDVAKPAVQALKAQRYDEAAALFESGLTQVREGSLSPKARSRYLYDYGVSLLAMGKPAQARTLIEEANGVRPDPRFTDLLAEIERQGADEESLQERGDHEPEALPALATTERADAYPGTDAPEDTPQPITTERSDPETANAEENNEP